MQNAKLFHRNFNLIVLGQIISLFGNAILSFALPLHLLKLTASGTIFGVVMAISIIPTILFSPIGGVIADRMNRRNIMVTLDFITCVIVLLSGFFIEFMAVPVISITLVFLSIIRSFYLPVVQSSIPAITSPENLLKGNSVINIINSLSALIGPILGGFLYSFFGLNIIIAIGSLAFFLSAVMELFIKMPHQKIPLVENPIKTAKSDFSGSLTFITKNQPVIIKTLGLVVFMNLLMTAFVTVGIPYIINIHLGLSSELYALAQSAMGLGALTGGLLVGLFSSKLTMATYHRPLLIASLFLPPMGFVLLLSNPMLSYWIILFSSMMILISGTMFSIAVLTYIQQLTPIDLIGKVMALITTFSLCALPLGQSLYGFLFENFPTMISAFIFSTTLLLLFLAFYAKKMWQRESLKELSSTLKQT